MDALIPSLGILGALALGAVSPGPSFVFVVRTSLALSRRDGIAAALGMGVGGVIFAALALLGLQAVLAKIAWLYAALRLAGGCYLLYLAWVVGALPPAVVLIETGWYTIVAAAFSCERPRAAYLRGKRWIDRAAGVVMGALGLRLVVEATQSG